MKIAVVTAVLNEADAIERLLRALAAQTRTPDVLLVADGGSTDGTLEKIAALAPSLPFGVQVLSIPGKIAKGRNAAIAQTQAEIVAVTDADCVPVPQWLEALTAPIESGKAAAVAGGYYADAATPIERAIATFTWVPLTANTTRFLPSHRSVAYLRSVWQTLGGYNEQIDSGEDTSFDLEVEKRFPYVAAPAP
jgi:glycosyltransferase involved in cell wall biosynthesis